MVVIHVKKTEQDQFLYVTTVTASTDDVIRDLVNVWNMRHRIGRIADACIDMSKHGPLKPANQRGIDEVQEAAGTRIEKGPRYNPDPLGHRTGNPPDPAAAATLVKTAEEAKAAVDKNQVLRKVALSTESLQAQIDLLRGAVTIAYPGGLPDHDHLPGMIEGKEELEGAASLDYLDPDTATLWWAGKQFFRDQTIGDRVGRNEKTKIVARLQKKGGGAPAREPAVSEAERKAMMAHYFKKQEQMKKLAENDEDDYVNSAWADPKALKRDLMGVRGVNMGVGGRRR